MSKPPYKLTQIRKLFNHYPYRVSTERHVLRPHIVDRTLNVELMCVPIARKVLWGFKTEADAELFKSKYKDVIVP